MLQLQKRNHVGNIYRQWFSLLSMLHGKEKSYRQYQEKHKKLTSSSFPFKGEVPEGGWWQVFGSSHPIRILPPNKTILPKPAG